MKKKSKRKTFLIIISIILALAIIQTLPIFFMKPMGHKTLSNDFINLYYQPGDEAGAQEVFDLLVEKSEAIYDQLDYTRQEPIQVHIYKTQTQLALREAGFITLLFAPEWHIGDCHNGKIMMLSPNTPIKAHTHDAILTATLHELVHSINYHINPDISYFWDNGLATYLAGQLPSSHDYDINKVPSIADMHTENGLKFGNMGGYAFSYLYIEYLESTYGWASVAAYAKGEGSYEAVFGKSEEELYTDWCLYLKTKG
jgi:hypothetical protein